MKIEIVVRAFFRLPDFRTICRFFLVRQTSQTIAAPVALDVVAIGSASAKTVIQSGGALKTPYHGDDVDLISRIGSGVSVVSVSVGGWAGGRIRCPFSVSRGPESIGHHCHSFLERAHHGCRRRFDLVTALLGTVDCAVTDIFRGHQVELLNVVKNFAILQAFVFRVVPSFASFTRRRYHGVLLSWRLRCHVCRIGPLPTQYGQQAFLCCAHIIGRKQKVYREISQFYGNFYRLPGENPGSRENLGMRTETVTRCGG